MHIADGVLEEHVLATAWTLSVVCVGVGVSKMDQEQVPRVGIMAAAFFVCSLVSVPAGLAKAHLMLLGLMGLLLGWSAFPALACALLLQAILFGHGGLIAFGANLFNMAAPAVACYYVFARFIRPETEPKTASAWAFAAGATSIVLSYALTSGALLWSGRGFTAVVGSFGLAHVPLLFIEGFITAAAVSFLRKARPELLSAPTQAPEGA